MSILMLRSSISGGSEPSESLPSQYVVDSALTWIAWDAPMIVYPGVDVDYKMTGYDWFNRALAWSIDSGPGWLSIGSTSGILTGTPPTDSVNESVTVRMTPAGGTAATKTFTLQVASSKCKFVATTGNDSNAGTLASPYLTIEKALDVAAASPSGGWTVLIRGGSYTEGWAGNVARWGQDFTAANPMTLRSYPGETVTITNSAKGFGTFQEYFVYYGLDIVGGSEPENGCLVVNAKNVAKLVNVSGYRLANENENPTGFMGGYDCILDSCTSEDNHGTTGGYNQNNSNYLHYCDRANTGLQAFYIDCIGAGENVINFKLKHSGLDRVHYHRCVAYGASNGFDIASNWATARFCLAVSDNTFEVGNGSAIAFGNSSGTEDDEGLLYDGCLLIALSGSNCLDLSFWGSQTASNCPIARANTLVTVATASTAGNGTNWAVRRQSYGSPIASPPVRMLVDNIIYSPSSSLVQLNATDSVAQLTLSQLNAKPECSGNTHAGALGSAELTYQAAGYNWSFTSAGGLVQGSAL